jgi:hypothetical protein
LFFVADVKLAREATSHGEKKLLLVRMASFRAYRQNNEELKSVRGLLGLGVHNALQAQRKPSKQPTFYIG